MRGLSASACTQNNRSARIPITRWTGLGVHGDPQGRRQIFLNAVGQGRRHWLPQGGAGPVQPLYNVSLTTVTCVLSPPALAGYDLANWSQDE